jgi:hypothetical protein
MEQWASSWAWSLRRLPWKANHAHIGLQKGDRSIPDTSAQMIAGINGSAFEALQRQADALYVVGTFISMIRSDDALPFNERTAQRLMKIAEHPVLTNTTHESHLPTSWTTLYELSICGVGRRQRPLLTR